MSFHRKIMRRLKFALKKKRIYFVIDVECEQTIFVYVYMYIYIYTQIFTIHVTTYQSRDLITLIDPSIPKRVKLHYQVPNYNAY